MKSNFEFSSRLSGKMWETISDNVGKNDVFKEFSANQIDQIWYAQPAQFNRAIQSIDKLAKVFKAKKDNFKAARRFYLNCLGSFYGKKY